MNRFLLERNFLCWFYSHWDVLARTDEKKVLFTFDDGPTGELTDKIISTLKEYDIRAIFFILGRNLEKFGYHPGYYRANNQILGFHGVDHTPINLHFDEREWMDYLSWLDTEAEVTFVRPPYGIFNHRWISFVNRLGKRVMMWNVTSYDYKRPARRKWAKKLAQTVRHGDILLLHDSEMTAHFYPDALYSLLDELKMMGKI